jgi:hypothetical protein
MAIQDCLNPHEVPTENSNKESWSTPDAFLITDFKVENGGGSEPTEVTFPS